MLDRLRWIAPGEKLEAGRVLTAVLYVFGVVLTLYIMWYALFAPSDRHLQGAVFISLVLPFCFLIISINPVYRRRTWIDYGLAALAFVVGPYYILNNEFYLTYIEGMYPLSTTEIAVGLILVVLTLEACRRCIGWGLTTIALLLVAYCAFGQYIPGEFGHGGLSLEYFITRQTVGENGIFGLPLAVAATYAFLFILFGTLYQHSGGGDLMFNLAAALTGRSIAGIPKSCVVSSGLYGSVSGSPTADVVTTGPITIPMMVKSGISRVRAGATEAAACCGGAFLPPVMGSVAFLMVEFTGISYLDVILASIFPAMLYYLGVFAFVQFEGMRNPHIGNIDGERLTVGNTLRQGWFHLLPIVALVTLIAEGYTAPYVASGSIVVVILASFFNNDRSRRIGPKAFSWCCVDTLTKMVILGAAVLCAGLIISAIDMSGLTGKFGALMIRIAGDSLPAVLVAAGVMLVLLGMGMPTPAVYIMGVALIAPVLISEFGLEVMPAHLFILFFSCMSAITPPMAVACFASATIANASPMKIGVDACRIGVAGFLLPFYIIYNHGVMGAGAPLEIGIDVLGAASMAIGAALALSNLASVLPLGMALRIGAAVGAMLSFSPEATWKCIGALLVVACLFPVIMHGKRRVQVS